MNLAIRVGAVWALWEQAQACGDEVESSQAQQD